MVVAAPHATFGLPEALRGIFAGAGGPPRLVRNVGLYVTSMYELHVRHTLTSYINVKTSGIRDGINWPTHHCTASQRA
jgi:hypothetical protein